MDMLTWDINMGCRGYNGQKTFPNDRNGLGVFQNVFDCFQELAGTGLMDEYLRRVAKHYSPKLPDGYPFLD